MANDLADFVTEYDLDGVDSKRNFPAPGDACLSLLNSVDYEDLPAFKKDQGAEAVTWLATFTKALRNKLPAGQYTISHAPLAPWFSDAYPQGGYLGVNKQVGSLIDWCVP